MKAALFIRNVIGLKKRKEFLQMASSKDYLEFVLEQLSELSDISYRAMMGEYIIYYQGRVIGGIYDDRFLVKDTKKARALIPDVTLEIPYEGAKGMLLVEDIENKAFLKELFETMVDELPLPKKKRK
jgi:TfoX/Sxy family transcriptional regulator of competence genes